MENIHLVIENSVNRCYKIVFPGYPFQRERCWIEPINPPPEPGISVHVTSEAAKLHPLLHRRLDTPLLKEASYTFSPDLELFCAIDLDSIELLDVFASTQPADNGEIGRDPVELGHVM